MKKIWYDFKFWFDGVFNPHVCGYKMEPVVVFFKKAYQFCTPWFGRKRMLMEEVCANYGKLLNTGLSKVYQRTRDGSIDYYLLTTYFGRVKFYRIRYIDKKSKEKVNAFISLVIPGLCGQDNSNKIVMEKKCLYKGWAFTRLQCLDALTEIRELSKNLEWEVMADNKRLYTLCEAVLKYLSGKKPYFVYDKMPEEEKEKELRLHFFLMQRDLDKNEKSFYKYVSLIQDGMELALTDPTPARNKDLKAIVRMIMNKVRESGYEHFWLKYFD